MLSYSVSFLLSVKLVYVRITLYNQNQTPAVSEGVNRLSFSEDVSCMNISYFREKQFVLNDATSKRPF